MVYIKNFSQVDKEDLAFAGGKGANLGEMTKIGLSVPVGFIIGTPAYFEFVKIGDLKKRIEKLSRVDCENPERLMEESASIIKAFELTAVPKEIETEIVSAYKQLSKGKVAVRSSATAEDLPEASFAGQQATFLNVEGGRQVVEKARSCWASLFTPRAIFYRVQNNFDHQEVGLAVIIQKMVEAAVSGVMFTIDPINNNKSLILVEAAYGLGEYVVGGKVTPDQYLVDKSNLKILDKKISSQNVQLVEVRGENREVAVSPKFASIQKLEDSKILELAKYGKRIEKHYYFPQDIEWASQNQKIYILQTRPVTTLAGKLEAKGENQKIELKPKTFNLKPILEGTAASPGIAIGPVKILATPKEISKIAKGDILVTSMTNPDFVPAMKKAVAVVTDRGGRTSHAAIVSREMGLPAVVGTEVATKILKNGQIVTVDGSKGKVYQGAPKINGKTLIYAKRQEPSIRRFKTVTKIYVNLAEPDRAEEISKLPVDGVGLLRAEFMIAEIGIHPKLAIKERKTAKFISKLYQGLLTFAKSFSPRPVIYRGTDFKTNEYRNLAGGAAFEPKEENPMIGFRGAARFITQPEVFQMELEAVKKVYKAGFSNLKLMIPFVRTSQELAQVKKIVERSGLPKFPDFELWMMIEVPSNVLLLEKFLEVGVDGVSIGSNDLTMLILGVDRDNENLSESFSEMDEAVLAALEKIIKTCRKFSVPVSICGQAPSVFEELVKKLVIWGISSISVSPDAVERTRQLVADIEKDLVLNNIKNQKPNFKNTNQILNI